MRTYLTRVPAAALALCAALAPPASAGPHGPAGWARGDLHQHTGHSDDGNWDVAALWNRIRETLPVGPRFTVTADHNDISGFFPNPARPPKADNFRAWGAVAEARRSLQSGRELFLAGQELGGLRGGHIGAVFLPQVDGRPPPKLITETGFKHRDWMTRIRAAGGLNVVYHPRGVDELGPVHPGTFTHWDECAELIELVSAWNGYKLYDDPDRVAWDWLWDHWLAGRPYVAVGGSDSHHSVKDEKPVPYWGIEERLGFHAHPMNPHNRAWLGADAALTEDTLRAAFRAGRVTVADWHENWAVPALEVAPAGGGAARRLKIGEAGGARVGDAVTYRLEGYGAPEVYSGDAFVSVEFGRVRARPDRVATVPAGRGESLEVRERDHQTVRVPVAPGDFAVAVPLDLGPGEWVVAARVVVSGGPKGQWRGAQLVNPIRLRISP